MLDDYIKKFESEEPIISQGEKVTEELKLKWIQFLYSEGKDERRFDLYTFIFGLCVFIIYVVPPFNQLLRWSYNNASATVQSVGVAVQATDNIVDGTIDFFTNDLSKTPKKGDVISGYKVTSPYGYRGDIGIPGASTFHKGVDLGTPTGTSVYAIGDKGTKVTVEAFYDNKGGWIARYSGVIKGKKYIFQYLHLKEGSIKEGEVEALSKIAETGDSGIGSEHFHLEYIDPSTNEKEPPKKWMLWISLTGRMP